jgi:hypothetical protein
LAAIWHPGGSRPRLAGPVLALIIPYTLFALLALVGTVVALILSIVTRRRYPRTTPLLQLGLAGLVLDRLLPVFYNGYVTAGGGGPLATIRETVNLFAELAMAVGIVLVIVALFVRRPAENPPGPAAPPAPVRPPYQPGWQQQPPPPQPYQPYGPGQR